MERRKSKVPPLYDMKQLRSDFIDVLKNREIAIRNISLEMGVSTPTVIRFISGGIVGMVSAIKIAKFTERQKALHKVD